MAIISGTVTSNLEFDFRTSTALFSTTMTNLSDIKLWLHLTVPSGASCSIEHYIIENNNSIFSTNAISETGTLSWEIPVFSKIKFISVTGNIGYQFEIKKA